tara:strand:+ start:1612 stop:2925 length:1314 start_codon:yes stop_codon:yes gene_type:complete
MSIELSIVVPIYNSEKYLSECLKSFCLQIKKNVEVILIDDASKDSSVKICKTFARRFNFIKLIRLKKNKGVSYCRNLGIENANGDYICFVDSDDKLIKNGIKIILNQLDKFKGKDVFLLKSSILNDKRNQNGSRDKHQTFEFKKKDSIISCTESLSRFRPTCWNFIVKQGFLKKNKIKFKDIITAEDWVFVSEVICLLKNFQLVKKTLYIHRAYELNTLGRKNGYVRANSIIKVIYELIEFILKKKNFLNRQKILYLSRIVKMSVRELLLNVGICTKLEVKKLSLKLNKSKKKFINLSRFGINHLDFLFKKKSISYNYFYEINLKKNTLILKFIESLPNKNTFLFCAGGYGRSTLERFNKIGIKINGIVDNNIAFKNKKIGNYRVKHSSYLKKNLKKFKNFNILICNNNIFDFKKIKTQLFNMGYLTTNIRNFNLLL